MKIRNGFVSNSSSSSFVVDLDILNEIKIKELFKLIDKHNEADSSGEGHLNIGKKHIFGKINHYDEGTAITTFLKNNNIYFEYGD